MALGMFLHVAGLGEPTTIEQDRGGANYDSLSYSLQPNPRTLASHRRARRTAPTPAIGAAAKNWRPSAPPRRSRAAHRGNRRPGRRPPERPISLALPPKPSPGSMRNSRGSGAPSSAPAANHHRLGATDCQRIRRSGRRWEDGVRRAWRIARQRLSAALRHAAARSPTCDGTPFPPLGSAPGETQMGVPSS